MLEAAARELVRAAQKGASDNEAPQEVAPFEPLLGEYAKCGGLATHAAPPENVFGQKGLTE
jgi:hypothetical protein